MNRELFKALTRDRGAVFRFTCFQCGSSDSSIDDAIRAYGRLLAQIGLPEAVWDRLASLTVSTGKFGGGDLVEAYRQHRIRGIGLEQAAPVVAGAMAVGVVERHRGPWFRVTLSVCSTCVAKRNVPKAVAEPSATLTLSPGRSPLPAKLRMDVLMRDGFRCKYCGSSPSDGVKLHVDHIVPVARGGQDLLENLVTACESCNLGKGAQEII